ncbi:MAG: GNAT family N-acetyltransferase [Bradymonadia bacterium]
MHREQQSLIHCRVASVYVVFVAVVSTVSVLFGSIQHHILSHWSSVACQVVGVAATIVVFAYLMRCLFHRFDRLGFVIDKCQIIHRSARRSRVFDWSSIRIGTDQRIEFVSAELRRLHRGLSTAKKRSLEEALLIRHRQREMNRLDHLPESAPSLRCQRVILRPWRSQDEQAYISLFQTTEIRRGHGISTDGPGGLSARFHQMIRPPSSSRQACWSWAVILSEGVQRPQIIGHIDAWLAPTMEPCLTLAYGLAPAFWSQGLMTECLERVVDMLDKEWGIRSVQARVFARNLRSIKLLVSLGFEPVGETRLRGRLVCDYRYRVLAASSHKVGQDLERL